MRQALLIVGATLVLGFILSWDLISNAVRGRAAAPPAATAPAASVHQGRPSEAPAVLAAGARVFTAQCSACHGPKGDWPIADRLKGRTRDEFYALLDHLPAVNPVMPGFHGTDEERRALAAYLGALSENREGVARD